MKIMSSLMSLHLYQTCLSLFLLLNVYKKVYFEGCWKTVLLTNSILSLPYMSMANKMVTNIPKISSILQSVFFVQRSVCRLKYDLHNASKFLFLSKPTKWTLINHMWNASSSAFGKQKQQLNYACGYWEETNRNVKWNNALSLIFPPWPGKVMADHSIKWPVAWNLSIYRLYRNNRILRAPPAVSLSQLQVCQQRCQDSCRKEHQHSVKKNNYVSQFLLRMKLFKVFGNVWRQNKKNKQTKNGLK